MKKVLTLIMALMMCAAVLTGCGSKEPADSGSGGNESSGASQGADNQNQEAETPEIKGEVFDAGNVNALVPEGWTGFPVLDMWSDDPEATDPNQLQICKGAESEWDLLTKPYVDIVYYDSKTSMMTPSSEWYDEASDLDPIELGGRTWNGFVGKSLDLPLAILWTGESSGDQFQVTVWLEAADGSVSVDDADVQAIIASIQPSA